MIIGIDECGYGSVAGDLFVSGFRAPEDWTFPGLKDSKKLTRKKREQLSIELNQLTIKDNNFSHTLSMSLHYEIDKLGLGACHKMGIASVIQKLYQPGDQVILDGNLSPKHLEKYGIDTSYNVKSVIKADDKIPTVMAASILGKTSRDAQMINIYHFFDPRYKFNENMGYLTADHKDAIRKFGLSDIHRKSYNIKL